ncbi:unnamed protein product [Parajaminaea phylloscopi]
MTTQWNSSLPVGLAPDPTRDGATVQDLEDFMDQVMRINSPQEFSGQMLAIMITLAILALAAGAVVVKRLATGRAFLIQAYPSRYGVFLIPNAILAFSTFLGVYAALYTAYVPLMIFKWQSDRGFFLWHTLIWIPLWLGAWMCGFGTLSSFPDALRLKKPQSGNQLHEYLIRPIVYNLACWGTPLLLIGSIVPPAVLAQCTFDRTAGRYKVWLTQSSSLHLAGDPDRLSLQQLYHDALNIWASSTRAWWYYSICMTMWIGWAALVFCVYCPIGLHTLNRVNDALKASEAKLRRRQAQTFYLFSRAEAESTLPADRLASGGRTSEGKFTHFARGDSAPAGVSPPRPIWAHRRPTAAPHTAFPGRQLIAGHDEGRLPCDDDDEIVRRTGPRHAPKRPQTAGRSHPDDGAFDPGVTTVFPPLKPDSKKPEKPDQLSPAMRRHKILRRIYRNLLILIVGVSTAILCFLSTTALLASQQYQASRNADGHAGKIQIIANYMAGWTNFVFGSLTIGAVFWRSFDSTLTLRAEDTHDSDSVSNAGQPNKARQFVANAVHLAGLARGSTSGKRTQSDAQNASWSLRRSEASGQRTDREIGLSDLSHSRSRHQSGSSGSSESRGQHGGSAHDRPMLARGTAQDPEMGLTTTTNSLLRMKRSLSKLLVARSRSGGDSIDDADGATKKALARASHEPANASEGNQGPFKDQPPLSPRTQAISRLVGSHRHGNRVSTAHDSTQAAGTETLEPMSTPNARSACGGQTDSLSGGNADFFTRSRSRSGSVGARTDSQGHATVADADESSYIAVGHDTTLTALHGLSAQATEPSRYGSWRRRTSVTPAVSALDVPVGDEAARSVEVISIPDDHAQQPSVEAVKAWKRLQQGVRSNIGGGGGARPETAKSLASSYRAGEEGTSEQRRGASG